MAVVLPVVFSAGFLPLSGCFLSSVLALDLSEVSAVKKTKGKFKRKFTTGDLHSEIVQKTTQFLHWSNLQNYSLILSIKKWLACSVQPSSYGCTREVAKHERSVRVARGDSQVRL